MIGFSTGSIAKGNFHAAIEALTANEVKAVELSALRESELSELLSYVKDNDFSYFNYVSFHAPSKLTNFSETELVAKLLDVAKRSFPIIVHPDIITTPMLWQKLGSNLLIENMDGRKSIGRTAIEMAKVLESLPEAGICFDIAHAKQVDPSMTEAAMIIQQLGSRIKQIHLSDIDSYSVHAPLNIQALLAYKSISYLLLPEVPVIIESPITTDMIKSEEKFASYLFDDLGFEKYLNSVSVSTGDAYKWRQARMEEFRRANVRKAINTKDDKIS